MASLSRLTAAASQFPSRQTIYQTLTVQAGFDSKADALLAPGHPPLSFGGLVLQVETMVTMLNQLGIGRGDRVAVLLPNGPEMALAFLAVAAGATCAPLNPASPARELQLYLSELKARAVIVAAGDGSVAGAVARSMDLSVIELLPSAAGAPAGSCMLRGDQRPPPLRPGFAEADDVALVLPTSGTTSRAKLVPLTHANLCTSAHNIRTTLRLGPGDRCLSIMPLFHIHGLIGALLSSLSAGAGVVCTPGFDPLHFFGWLDAFRPTWYTAVPTMHQAILAHAPDHAGILSRAPLRFIRSSSAPLPPPVMAGLEKLFTAPVLESYGMTEASHQMASNPLPPGERKAGSVGLPAGPEVAIMDEVGRLLPAQSVGEVVIRGASVTGGYENDPSANAITFCDGWFRTGDLGRKDDEGYYYLVGRKKEMINRGGESISPREIDEVLLQHPAVAQAVAFAIPHASLGEDVAAAVVLKDQADVREGDLRAFAFTRLAGFKVPSQIVFIDSIPKGPTGKLQRIGLCEKFRDRLQREFVAPRTDSEEILVQLWREVLPVDRIGVHDNFFGLGGDSLAAAGLVARINARFELDLAATSVFRAPSIAEQSVLLETALLDEIESD